MSSEPVCVGIFNSEIDAEIARSKLASEGIRAVIFKDDAGGMMQPMQLVMGVKLMVTTGDVEKALEILEQEEENE